MESNFFGGEFFTILNRFSRYDLATAQMFPPLLSLKFVDPAVILIPPKKSRISGCKDYFRFFVLIIHKLQH